MFRRLAKDDFLLVSQAGEFLFLTANEFDLLISNDSKIPHPRYDDLESKQIIGRGSSDFTTNLLATKLRSKKGFLRDFTILHMIVVTGNCNCKCEYCQASSSSTEQGTLNMTKETARRVVDTIFQCPSPSIKIEFQGGEPLINWNVVRYIVQYAETKNIKIKKNLEFVLCTNLMLINDEILKFLYEHSIQISTSLDGPKQLHDKNRLSRNGTSSYDVLLEKLTMTRKVFGLNGPSPLLTITKHHLNKLKDVVNEYVNLGFNGVFMRSLNPYGIAKQQWDQLGYPIEDFIDSYINVLRYIIQLNLDGHWFPEYYATLLLTRILTPFSTGFVDLQSPSGAGISGAIYDFDGSVYPADEARMLARTGDKRFFMGNVHYNSYIELFNNHKLHELINSSCVEVLPGCAWCAYQLYCGSDPIRNYVESGDIVGHRPTSEFCKKHSAVIEYLFGLIHDNDDEIMNVFWSWITKRPLADVRL